MGPKGSARKVPPEYKVKVDMNKVNRQVIIA